MKFLLHRMNRTWLKCRFSGYRHARKELEVMSSGRRVTMQWLRMNARIPEKRDIVDVTQTDAFSEAPVNGIRRKARMVLYPRKRSSYKQQ